MIHALKSALEFSVYLIVITAVICTIGGLIFYLFDDGKVCKVYSEQKTRRGFIVVGKVVTPTTYQDRECLVYGEGK